MNKKKIVIIILAFAIGCAVGFLIANALFNNKDNRGTNEAGNKNESNLTEEEEAEYSYEFTTRKGITPMNTDTMIDSYPKNFKEVWANINGEEIKAYTDNRYYIFYAETEAGVSDWYVYDISEGLYVRYEPEFMNAPGKIKDVPAEISCNIEKEIEFVTLQVEDKPEEDFFPGGFREVSVLIDGTEYEAWFNDRYYIFYAESPSGGADWYVYDFNESLYVRYDPSFMNGQLL